MTGAAGGAVMAGPAGRSARGFTAGRFVIVDGCPARAANVATGAVDRTTSPAAGAADADSAGAEAVWLAL